MTADLAWRGSAVRPARVTVYLFEEVMKGERNTDLIYEILKAKLEVMGKKRKERGCED